MSEFLQGYGFFIVIAILMLVCHLGHGFGHGGHGGDEEKDDGKRKGPTGGGHRH